MFRVYATRMRTPYRQLRENEDGLRPVANNFAQTRYLPHAHTFQPIVRAALWLQYHTRAIFRR